MSMRSGGQLEQMMGLDQLEPLVHQGRRVDGDLRPHAPGRVRHRLRRRHVAHLRRWLRSRNGPPLHVRVIFSIPSTRSKSKHCQIALCSLSTGSRVAPCAATSRMNRLPAQTSTSLLAKATMRPWRTAARVGSSPAAPTIAGHHPIGRPLGRLDQRRAAAGDLDAGCRRAPPSGPDSRPDRRPRRSARRAAFACSASKRRVAVGGQRLDGEGVAVAQQQVDRALPDRPGRAEDRDPARRRLPAPLAVARGHRHVSTLPPPIRVSSATAGITARRPSSRSSSPPCPGMRPLSPSRRTCAWPPTPQDRRTARQSQARRSPAPAASTGEMPSAARRRPAGERGARDAAGEPRPGLARAPARREARPAEPRPADIGADVGRPDDREDHSTVIARRLRRAPATAGSTHGSATQSAPSASQSGCRRGSRRARRKTSGGAERRRSPIATAERRQPPPPATAIASTAPIEHDPAARAGRRRTAAPIPRP